MNRNVDLRYYIIKTLDKFGQPHDGYDKCLCSAGFLTCKTIKGGGFGSIWKINEEITAGEGFPQDRYGNSTMAKEITVDKERGLYATLKYMKAGGKDVVMDLGRAESLLCLNPDFSDAIRDVIAKKDSSIIFNPAGVQEKERIPVTAPPSPIPGVPGGIVKPSRMPEIAIKHLELDHDAGAYWETVIGNGNVASVDKKLETETEPMWDVTVKEGVETQTAICMEGDTLSVLKDGDGKPRFIKGNERSVRAYSRDLECPSTSIKVGTLHTHPPKTQEEMERGLLGPISDDEIELTHEQSVQDLDLLASSGDILTCTRSKKSITCFVNTTSTGSDILLRDVLQDREISRDKQRLKGEMMDRGIQKFVTTFTGFDSTAATCIEKDDGKKSTVECAATVAPLDRLMKDEGKVKEAMDRVSFASKGRVIRGERLNVVNASVSSSIVIDNGKERARALDITPYSTPLLSCREGTGNVAWCDGVRPLSTVKIHKDLLVPKFERQVWDVMYDDLDQDFTRGPLWLVLENYVKVLEISSKDSDVKKRNRIKGIMTNYLVKKDNNEIVRELLPLIRLE